MERCKESNFISLKELPNVAPSNIFDNGRSLTEPQEVATDIQSSIRFSKNNFHDFLTKIFNCAIRYCQIYHFADDANQITTIQ